jgi:outer membrane protein
MSSSTRKTVHVGFLLALLVALLAFFAKSASAQATTPQRLSLGDAARLAARQSTPTEEAALRAGQAGQRVREARSALLPNFSANASQTAHTLNSATFGLSFPTAPGQAPFLDPHGQVIGPVNLSEVRGRVSQTIFDPSTIERIRSAQSSQAAATADVSNVAEQAAATAAAAYLRVVRAQAQVSARLADSSLATDLLNIARDQLKAGVGVALDVTRAQSQLALIRAQLIGARNDRDRSELELKRSLNVPLEQHIELTDSLGTSDEETVPPTNEDAAIAQALRTRPDVRALEAQLRASQQSAAAIRAERLPSVGAFGDDGLIGYNLAHMLPTYSIGVQLSLPIFDGFRRAARVEEQSLASHELEVRQRDLRQQVAVEVRSALLDLESARQQVDASLERLRLSEQEVAQARERFSAGVAGNADVITAQLSLNAARTSLIDVETSYQNARVALARAEGSVTTLQ